MTESDQSPSSEQANISSCVRHTNEANLSNWSDDQKYGQIMIKWHNTGVSCESIMFITFGLNTPLHL